MPSEAKICSSTPARRAARKHSSVSASSPLTMTLRTILIAAAAPMSGPATETRMSSAGQDRLEARGVRPGQQGRGLMARRMHRRHHGHIHIARVPIHCPRSFLLAAWRHRIDIEEILIGPQERLGLFGRLKARCSGDGRDDQIRVPDGVTDRGTSPHADTVSGVAQRSPSGLGNRMSHAATVLTPASRSPAASAWPASPNPMKQTLGVFGRAMTSPLICCSTRSLPGGRRFGMPVAINFIKEDGLRPESAHDHRHACALVPGNPGRRVPASATPSR